MISALEKYGAFRANSPNPLHRFETRLTLIAAKAPSMPPTGAGLHGCSAVQSDPDQDDLADLLEIGQDALKRRVRASGSKHESVRWHRQDR